MGSIIGKAMKDSMEEQQRFMLETQRMQMERQMALQCAMQQRMMAAQLSRAKEMFNWLAAFYVTYAAVAAVGVGKTGKKALLTPLLPLTFIVGYQADLAHGNKTARIKKSAEQMIEEESALFLPPKGLPTFEEIEALRGKK